MSARKYDFLTRSCFLAAILSSMLYGKLGAYNWLALGVGAASAVVAVATYFYNARKLERAEQPNEQDAEGPHAFICGSLSPDPATPEPAEIVLSRNQGPADTKISVSLKDSAAPEKVTMARTGETQTTLWKDAFTTSLEQDHYIVLKYYERVHEVSFETAQHRERRLFLDEVVQLVDRFSPTCEIEVSLADRHLTIRPARPTRPAHIKSREERQETDLKLPTEDTSGMVN